MVSNLLIFFMEFIGTFIFIYIVLKYQEPIPCGLAFTGLLYFNKLTNGTYNPASSIAKYLNQEIDTDKFLRLKIGIDRPELAEFFSDYCLTEFSQSQNKKLKEVVTRAMECCLDWVNNGAGHAMSKFNI